MNKVYIKRNSLESFYDSEKNIVNMYTFKFISQENEINFYKLAIRKKECVRGSGVVVVFNMDHSYAIQKTFYLTNALAYVKPNIIYDISYVNIDNVISAYICGLIPF